MRRYEDEIGDRYLGRIIPGLIIVIIAAAVFYIKGCITGNSSFNPPVNTVKKPDSTVK